MKNLFILKHPIWIWVSLTPNANANVKKINFYRLSNLQLDDVCATNLQMISKLLSVYRLPFLTAMYSFLRHYFRWKFFFLFFIPSFVRSCLSLPNWWNSTYRFQFRFFFLFLRCAFEIWNPFSVTCIYLFVNSCFAIGFHHVDLIWMYDIGKVECVFECVGEHRLDEIYIEINIHWQTLLLHL